MHTVKEKTWYIAHNGIDTFHTGYCEAGTNLDSGQPIIEQFVSQELQAARYLELTGEEIPIND